jgi:hypothetical protein
MPKYKIRAEETIYAIYETEIEAEDKISVSDYDNTDLSNSAGEESEE